MAGITVPDAFSSESVRRFFQWRVDGTRPLTWEFMFSDDDVVTVDAVSSSSGYRTGAYSFSTCFRVLVHLTRASGLRRREAEL